MGVRPAEVGEGGSVRAEQVETSGPKSSHVFARSLGECLSLQLLERDRLDPAMAALVANLELVAKRDWPGLCRICSVDMDDLKAMLAELRKLDPKPGHAFGSIVAKVKAQLG